MSEMQVFTPPGPLNTAVLFLVFNRLDTTTEVFEAIRQAKPPRLYIAADGPRDNREGEAEKVQAVRDFVMSGVDWACEVKTLFREENLGCKYAVSSAITWFFEHEEEGIILEDDVVPHQLFFGYCESLLDRFRLDLRVMVISGFNPDGAGQVSNEVYYSDLPSIWGWATWRGRWKLYDISMESWPSKEFKDHLCRKFSFSTVQHFSYVFDLVKSRRLNTWDYQWVYTVLANSGLTIKPLANLVSNVGVEGTHSIGRDKNHFTGYGVLELEKLSFPVLVVPNTQEDRKYCQRLSRVDWMKGGLAQILRGCGLYAPLKRLEATAKRRGQ
jgi:hypothetical protein